MNWTRFAITVLAAGIAISLTDWLFMGVLFHEKYKRYPEIWRKPQGGGESTAILFSTVLGFLTSAVFACLCHRLNLHTLAATLKLAAAIWVIAPLPLLITNALWIKLDPAITVTHAAGWLMRLLLVAAAVNLIMQ